LKLNIKIAKIYQKFKIKLKKYIAKQKTIQLMINFYIIDAILLQKNEYRKNLLLSYELKKF